MLWPWFIARDSTPLASRSRRTWPAPARRAITRENSSRHASATSTSLSFAKILDIVGVGGHRHPNADTSSRRWRRPVTRQPSDNLLKTEFAPGRSRPLTVPAGRIGMCRTSLLRPEGSASRSPRVGRAPGQSPGSADPRRPDVGRSRPPGSVLRQITKPVNGTGRSPRRSHEPHARQCRRSPTGTQCHFRTVPWTCDHGM